MRVYTDSERLNRLSDVTLAELNWLIERMLSCTNDIRDHADALLDGSAQVDADQPGGER